MPSTTAGATSRTASAICSRVGPKKLLPIGVVGTPLASAAIMSRTLRDVQVAQSPAAITSAA